jgi:DNA-binding NarL/FixJ family response regulator
MHIIIADNHELFTEGLCRILTDFYPSSIFHKAGSGDQLFAYCRELVDVDLIMMDLNMRGWSGTDLLQQVRSLSPQIPVVVVSASEDHHEVQQVLNRGAAGYVPKTSTIPVLAGAVRLVLAGGKYLPPEFLLRGQGKRSSIVKTVDEGSEMTLTSRQKDILHHLQTGKSNKQIACEFGISEGTVKVHITAIFRRLKVQSRTQAVIATASLVNQR